MNNSSHGSRRPTGAGDWSDAWQTETTAALTGMISTQNTQIDTAVKQNRSFGKHFRVNVDVILAVSILSIHAQPLVWQPDWQPVYDHEKWNLLRFIVLRQSHNTGTRIAQQ